MVAARSGTYNSSTTGMPACLLPKSHNITVGAAGKLVFEPSQIYAEVGDLLQFNFLALNHTLTQSSLSNPCTHLGGFSTGFNQFNPRNISGEFVVQYAVTTLAPQWFFCAQTKNVSHCHAGMTFALNPDSGLESLIQKQTSSLPVPSILSTDTSQFPTTTATSQLIHLTSAPLHSATGSSLPSTGSGTRVVGAGWVSISLVMFLATRL
jgi:plastocyanin